MAITNDTRGSSTRGEKEMTKREELLVEAIKKLINSIEIYENVSIETLEAIDYANSVLKVIGKS